MSSNDLEARIRSYLDCYDQRNLAACMDFFARDATINFAIGTYRGQAAIEGWHKDRFEADLRVLQVDEIKIQDSTAVLDVVATSKTSRAWSLNTFAGRIKVVFDQGLIAEAEFALRTALPLEQW